MEYRCEKCNKKYSSYQSLWIHNKKYHKIETINKLNLTNHIPIKNNQSQNIKTNDTIKCKFCNKIFSHYNNKWRHEKSCKNNKFIELQSECDKLKKELELTKKLLPNDKNNIKANKQINNGTINNITINQIGKETIDSMPIKDILKITGSGNNMPILCIKNLNFNENLPENHSFCTTTLEGKHFTRINSKTQKPEKINKIDFINEVLNSSLRFISNISLMAEFDKTFRNKIPLEHQEKMKDILNNQLKFYEPKNKKAFFNCINDMSYNFKDIILETWKLLQPIKIDSDEPPLLDENYNYWSDSDIEI